MTKFSGSDAPDRSEANDWRIRKNRNRIGTDSSGNRSGAAFPMIAVSCPPPSHRKLGLRPTFDRNGNILTLCIHLT